MQKFCGFRGSIGNLKNFQVKYIACGVGLGHARLPANVFQFSSVTTKLFHLERFAMYGMYCCYYRPLLRAIADWVV